MVIENKKNQPLTKQTGTLPDVSGGMLDWFQPLTFILVKKNVVGFQDAQVLTPVDFQGVVQFLTEDLSIKEEGQRAWRKISIHANTALSLEVDEIVEYINVRYRVLSMNDFSNYGYFYYTLVEDWEDIPSPISYPLVHTVLQFGLTMRGLAA